MAAVNGGGTVSARQVVIIGAGPTGLALAVLLARAGIGSVVVEQDAGPQAHPAACILNTRSMEILRQIGIEAEVMERCQDLFTIGNIAWVSSLAGEEFGRCSVLPDDVAGALAASPSHGVHFSQSRLEPLLWRAVERCPDIELLKSHRCDEVAQVSGEATAVVTDLATGRVKELRAAYLVGCDGASSRVRRSAGIRFDGEILNHMLSIHFSADLGRYVDHRKSLLYWIMSPAMFGVLVGHWLPKEWILLAPYFPPQQRFEDFSDDDHLKLIHAAVGTREIANLEVHAVGPWALSGKIAERYRHGRIFIAGDAAHGFPPTGGFGLNTGIQDSHNLAWKLAMVLSGTADPRLLDSYETERRPIARRYLDQCLHNYEAMNDLNRLVGFDFKYLRVLRRVQESALLNCLPEKWQRRIVETAVRTALSRMGRLAGKDRRGRRLRAEFVKRLPGQYRHYRFLGLDLGFDYAGGAVARESTPKPEGADPVADYRPTTWPGARLPHLWLTRAGETISSHDLLRPDRLLLLTQPAEAAAWAEATRALSNGFAMPVECLSVGAAGAADLVDRDGVWGRLCEVGPTGAVLVRPDGHVAWRTEALPQAPAEALGGALDLLSLNRT